MIKLLCGDVLDKLKTLPSESVQCCVTSPPYWGLRDYGVKGQLGQEKTPEEYVAEMVEVFREVRRVLRKDGTLWLNIGDSYFNTPTGTLSKRVDSRMTGGRKTQHVQLEVRWVERKYGASVKYKDLVGIPWMLAFALRTDGWHLRQDIIWAKPNPMPESVTDRCTKSHEYLFLLTKSAKYFYDHYAVQEPCVKGSAGSSFNKGKTAEHQLNRSSEKERVDGEMRNRRDVWTIATHPYKEAHFATFPEALVEPCLLAGTSSHGCCPQCGEPYRRVMRRTPMVIDRSSRTHALGRTRSSGSEISPPTAQLLGWEMDCPCEYLPKTRCTVLDPFCGSGTVGAVCRRLDLNFIGIDLNKEYLQMARRRIGRAH